MSKRNLSTLLQCVYFVTKSLYYDQLLTTITIDEPAPGLKTIVSFRVPDQRSGKVSNVIISSFCMMTSYLVSTNQKRNLYLTAADFSNAKFLSEILYHHGHRHENYCLNNFLLRNRWNSSICMTMQG